jgi:signal transduction histidine kinase
VRAAVTRIVRAGDRAGQIIGRIRAQFEKGALNREVSGVSEIVRETVGLLHDEAVRYNIGFRTELTADLLQIVGDRVQLQQVAMNLVVNSIIESHGGRLWVAHVHGRGATFQFTLACYGCQP